MAYRESCENLLLSVRRLHLPKEEIVLVGGTALEVFGIDYSHTIDLVVSPEVMLSVIKKADKKDRGYSLGHIGIMTQVKAERFGRSSDGPYGCDVTFMPAPHDHLYKASFEELRDEAIDASDVLVSPPERILDWKRNIMRLGIHDDLTDIRLIEEYLLSHDEPYATYGGWEPGENPGIKTLRQASFEGTAERYMSSANFPKG